MDGIAIGHDPSILIPCLIISSSSSKDILKNASTITKAKIPVIVPEGKCL